MGAVYDVSLKLYYNDEQDVINATQAFIAANSGHAVFHEDYSSLISTIQIILPKRGFYLDTQTDNYISCNCGFDASYGWESVMQDWFNSIATDGAVLNNSTIRISPDSGWERGVLQDGTVHWTENEGGKWGIGAEGYPFQYPERNQASVPQVEEREYIPMTVDDPLLQEAINAINDYCYKEFDHIGVEEGDDLSDIGVMYSTAGDDDDHEVQVTLDLVNFKVKYYVDQEFVGEDDYGSLQNMLDQVLKYLDFDNLYGDCCDYIDDEE